MPITKIKICGLTRLDDALLAVQVGADLLGFIFYESSPRYVAPAVAAEIVTTVKQHVSDDPTLTMPRFVGVFVNAARDRVVHTLESCGLDQAQLHGDEPPEFVQRFAGRAFKAIRPQSHAEAEALAKDYLPAQTDVEPPTFLFDAYHPTLYGGTGHVTDWTMAATFARRFPLMLAGSLTPTNVAEAIATVQPWAVDVSSGVEAAKGRKDEAKVRAFVDAVRDVKRET